MNFGLLALQFINGNRLDSLYLQATLYPLVVSPCHHFTLRIFPRTKIASTPTRQI